MKKKIITFIIICIFLSTSLSAAAVINEKTTQETSELEKDLAIEIMTITDHNGKTIGVYPRVTNVGTERYEFSSQPPFDTIQFNIFKGIFGKNILTSLFDLSLYNYTHLNPGESLDIPECYILPQDMSPSIYWFKYKVTFNIEQKPWRSSDIAYNIYFIINTNMVLLWQGPKLIN